MSQGKWINGVYHYGDGDYEPPVNPAEVPDDEFGIVWHLCPDGHYSEDENALRGVVGIEYLREVGLVPC